MTTSRNIYDAAGRLTTGTRYAGSSTTGTAAFTERGISYDRTGGMLGLQRYGQNSSTAEDNFSLTYNGMKLSSVTGTIDGQSISATFSYDDCGRTTYDGVSSQNYVYDQLGALASVADASTSATLSTYRHLADGTKYLTISPNGGALLYRGPFTLKVADISAITPSVTFLRAETGSAGAAIIANASGTGATPYYYVADHIGSVRAIVDAQGNIVERNDYYTYGKRHTTGRTYSTLSNSQLLFSGKEDQGQALDLASGAATGTSGLRILDFGARHYDPIVPRWTTQDPLAEKYFPINPYAYCAGDPVNLVDLDGKNPLVVFAVAVGVDYLIQVVVNLIEDKPLEDALWNDIDITSLAAAGFTAGGNKYIKGLAQIFDAIFDFTPKYSNLEPNSPAEIAISITTAGITHKVNTTFSDDVVRKAETEAQEAEKKAIKADNIAKNRNNSIKYNTKASDAQSKATEMRSRANQTKIGNSVKGTFNQAIKAENKTLNDKIKEKKEEK